MSEYKTSLPARPRLTRRDFLKLAGLVGTGAAYATLNAHRTYAAPVPGPHLPGPNGDTIIPTMCEMCVWRCGVRAKVRDGRIRKLEGNPDHLHSQGHLCARGQSGLMMTYDPDRLPFPLKRIGPRGSGRFERISWEQALDEVADRMLQIKEQYGPEAMIFSSTHNLSQPLFENLLNAYGSPNYGTQRSLCFNAMVAAHLTTFGIEEPNRDYEGVKYVILTGRNLMEAISTNETKALMQAIADGAHVVYVDPRFTKTAAKASEWLPIRPGTDLAFHLALINVIVREKLYDADFVTRYTVGFEELERTIQPYTPEWAAPLTEIPAETITRIARDFAAARPDSFAHPGWRTSNFVNSFQTERAITILNALVGVCHQPGVCRLFSEEPAVGLGAPPQPPYPRARAARLDGVPWKYPLVPLKLGVFQELRDNILTGQPYQARGWFISRQNPAMSIPERAKTVAAFEKLDLMVVVDIFVNDTGWYADYILPEATYLERYDPLHVVADKVFIRQPVIEPLGEAKSALWIYKQLGERLGLGDYVQYEDDEDYIKQQLAPLGIDFDMLRQVGYFEVERPDLELSFVWNTPSGKIEIASETLRGAGFSAVPVWEEPPAPPAGQFYLLTGKVGQHTQFATQNNLYLHEVFPINALWIHPIPAAERGIENGDRVTVRSEVGEVQIEALVTEAIRPDCVYMAPGFGHISKGLTTAFNQGASSSDVHVTYTDPISGGQALTQTFVTVEKAPVLSLRPDVEVSHG